MRKRFAVKHTFIDNKQGPDGVVNRLICYEIDTSLAAANKALDNGYGISYEDIINRDIKDFGLSYADGESYHTGLMVFKRYKG